MDLQKPPRKSLQRKILKLLASVLLCWQALAILIAPSPGSYAMSKIYPLIKPYLVATHQNNEWSFFAPDPAKGTLLRYLLVDHTGQQHVFKLTENLQRSDSGFFRYASLYLSISRKNINVSDSAHRYLCIKHQEMRPSSIQFFMGHQLAISPKSFVAGHRPLGHQYMSLEYFASRSCEHEA